MVLECLRYNTLTMTTALSHCLLFLDIAVLGLDSGDSGKVKSSKHALQPAWGPPSISVAVWSRWLEFGWSLWYILEPLSSSL